MQHLRVPTTTTVSKRLARRVGRIILKTSDGTQSFSVQSPRKNQYSHWHPCRSSYGESRPEVQEKSKFRSQRRTRVRGESFFTGASTASGPRLRWFPTHSFSRELLLQQSVHRPRVHARSVLLHEHPRRLSQLLLGEAVLGEKRIDQLRGLFGGGFLGQVGLVDGQLAFELVRLFG